jgi:hypothetical protein
MISLILLLIVVVDLDAVVLELACHVRATMAFVFSLARVAVPERCFGRALAFRNANIRAVFR